MKQKSLFDICVCKKTSPEELLQWLGFERDCYVIDLGDRYLRVLAHRDAVQFSEPKKTFDRWANSSAETFELHRMSERKAFLKMLMAIDPKIESLLSS